MAHHTSYPLDVRRRIVEDYKEYLEEKGDCEVKLVSIFCAFANFQKKNNPHLKSIVSPVRTLEDDWNRYGFVPSDLAAYCEAKLLDVIGRSRVRISFPKASVKKQPTVQRENSSKRAKNRIVATRGGL